MQDQAERAAGPKPATILLRSVLHNAGVVAVGFAVGFVGSRLDLLLGIARFHSIIATAAGWLLVVAGFLLRAWATYAFYQHRMRVISLVPQGALLTSGPYRYSRNPLYLGGNVFVFFGAALVLGSTMALVITALHLPLVDLFIRREEKQLERSFGEAWIRYRQSVRRWL
jgi:protein-S-isoprenylcysteine O-methyltransferase Ste14